MLRSSTRWHTNSLVSVRESRSQPEYRGHERRNGRTDSARRDPADRRGNGSETSCPGESAKLILHSGRTYGRDTSSQRHDHARHPSSDTAIEGSAQRTSPAQHGLNQKTVAKWRKRAFVHDAPMEPKTARSTVLSTEEEAMIVAFRKRTLLPLDDYLYALRFRISRQPPARDRRRQVRQAALQAATSTSTSPRSAPKKASSISSWRRTGPPSTPSSGW
jgi:hypothetical protein